ncbi:MAG: hypothetical protein Q4F44_00750 [Bacteroidales bacterium]|nr:hypothetical protein [Bacteroidales bacterium]
MLNISGYNEQIEREEWIKRFGMRSSTLCAVLFIAAVMYLAVQWGYDRIAIHLCKVLERSGDGVAGGGNLL